MLPHPTSTTTTPHNPQLPTCTHTNTHYPHSRSLPSPPTQTHPPSAPLPLATTNHSPALRPPPSLLYPYRSPKRTLVLSLTVVARTCSAARMSTVSHQNYCLSLHPHHITKPTSPNHAHTLTNLLSPQRLPPKPPSPTQTTPKYI